MDPIILAIDIGGTFTDVVMADLSMGRIWTTKTPSTSPNAAQGFFQGIDKILAIGQKHGSDVVNVLHGSTVATNAILEGKGAKVGFITTAGFKYVLEIGRHEIPRQENLYVWTKPKRPVPPRLIREVSERILINGTIDKTLEVEEVQRAALELARLGVECIAITFINSYANPLHENKAAEAVHAALPGMQVCISSDVLSVFREYERSMTTVLNAYIQPLVSRYVNELTAGLEQRDIAAPLFIMKSNGGVFGPKQASRQAVNMVLSGPAAGAVGAAHLAQVSGFPNVITIDIGGTSADVTLICDGKTHYTTEGEIGNFPIAIPTVDIYTIGAGGGSLARVLENGIIVGPQSAGADPGPACYGRGGVHPTVTDANLVLGRIPPYLLGGEIALYPELAKQAIQNAIARPLGMDVVEAAEGILQIANNNMVGALKVVSVERGYDPHAFALVAFGGLGPLHANELAHLLGTSTVIVPPHPGLLCAVGLLSSDVIHDYARTCLQRGPDFNITRIEQVFQELEAAARADVSSDGVQPDCVQLSRYADLRYQGQGSELTIEIPSPTFDAKVANLAIEAFHALHEQLYTFADRTVPVEFVTLRIHAVGSMSKFQTSAPACVREGTPAQAQSMRRVYFNETGFIETAIYCRKSLVAGHRIVGPAVVEQLDTATIILPDQAAQVDRHGNLVIKANESTP